MTRRVRATRPAGERGAETARSRPPEAASDDLGGERTGLRTRSGRGKKKKRDERPKRGRRDERRFVGDSEERSVVSFSSAARREDGAASEAQTPTHFLESRRAPDGRDARDATIGVFVPRFQLLFRGFQPSRPGKTRPAVSSRPFSRLGGGGGDELGEEIFDPEHPPLDGVQPVAHLDRAEPRPNLASSTRRGIPRQTARE